MTRSSAFRQNALSLAITICVVVVAAALAATGSVSTQSVATLAVINLILVLGTHVFIGNSGVLSFGQMAFAAIGAYTAGLLRVPLEEKEIFMAELPGFLAHTALGTVPSILIGGLVAAAVAAVIGVPLMRLSGISAGLATLSLLFIVQVVAGSWESVTGGSKGLTPLPVTVTLWDAVYWAIGILVVVFVYQTISRGVLLRASRDDEAAAKSTGVNVVFERLVAFVLSAFVCGLGGGLYALFLGAVDPTTFFVSITFLVITMLVIGGMGSVGGAVVGSIVVSVLVELLRRAQTDDLGFIQIPSRAGTQTLVLATVLFLVILLRPDGLTRGRELASGWLRRAPLRFASEHREKAPEQP